MKITDSPAAILLMPLKATAASKLSELSSNFQPLMSMVLLPRLVISNQSAVSGLLPLDQGATSEMMRSTVVGFSMTWSINRRSKLALASGVAPTAESSTVTVTA